MRLRGVIVGRLDRSEDPFPAVPLDKMGDPTPGLARGDTDHDVVAAGELSDKFGRAGK